MPLNCPDPKCPVFLLPSSGDLPGYLSQYSLESGVQFVSVAISVPIQGGGFYIVPAGTISFVVALGAQFVSYQGCSASISMPLPPNATAAQVAAVAETVILQAAYQVPECVQAGLPIQPYQRQPGSFY